MRRPIPLLLFLTTLADSEIAHGAVAAPPDAVLFLDFDEDEATPIRLHHGAKRTSGKFGTALQFTTAMQYAEVDFSRRLDGTKSLAVGGWFLPKRAGEQAFLFRGVPHAGENGERM